MRIIHNKERVQRGCIYCEEVMPPEKDGRNPRQRKCPHEECPYHQLDGMKTYGEYLDTISTEPIASFLMTALRNGE